MKYLILILALGLCACTEDGGSGTTNVTAPNLTAPTLTPTPTPAPTYTVKSGTSFSCLIAQGELWCRGQNGLDAGFYSPNAWVLIASPTDPDGLENITAFAVWDHTVCYQLWVAERPSQRTAGPATFCIGPHFLAGSYSQHPIAFAFQSPQNDSYQNGALDHTYSIQPFVGADMTLTQFIGLNLIQDTNNSVSETTEQIQLQ